MPRPRLQVNDHLTYEELAVRFRSCTDGRQKARWQALWLLRHPRQPRSAALAAELVGLSADAVRKLVRRYYTEGPAAVERPSRSHSRANYSAAPPTTASCGRAPTRLAGCCCRRRPRSG
jgi:hypothetical protein